MDPALRFLPVFLPAHRFRVSGLKVFDLGPLLVPGDG